MISPAKVAHARTLIRTALKRFRRPAIMCSFGKDSMALLLLVRGIDPDLPVIFHQEPFQPRKYAYARRIIELLDLTVYDFPPATTAVQEGGGEIEIMNYYPIGSRTVALPTGLRDPEPGERVICALRDIYDRPTGTFAYPWDLVFHGHKSCDVDPILGPVPLAADYALNVGAATAAYPLRDWTDDDVWAYLEAADVPLHLERYEKVDGRWQEKADKRLNPDYISACTACMRASGPRAVPCPKLGGAAVQNVSSQLRQVKLPDLPYLQRPTSQTQT